jgi:hypothetical protein
LIFDLIMFSRTFRETAEKEMAINGRSGIDDNSSKRSRSRSRSPSNFSSQRSLVSDDLSNNGKGKSQRLGPIAVDAPQHVSDCFEEIGLLVHTDMTNEERMIPN